MWEIVAVLLGIFAAASVYKVCETWQTTTMYAHAPESVKLNVARRAGMLEES